MTISKIQKLAQKAYAIISSNAHHCAIQNMQNATLQSFFKIKLQHHTTLNSNMDFNTLSIIHSHLCCFTHELNSKEKTKIVEAKESTRPSAMAVCEGEPLQLMKAKPAPSLAQNSPKENVSASQIDEVLANITKSSARLESSLAKMPPLPKFTPSSSIYNRSKFLRSFLMKTPKVTRSYASTQAATAEAESKCQQCSSSTKYIGKCTNYANSSDPYLYTNTHNQQHQQQQQQLNSKQIEHAHCHSCSLDALKNSLKPSRGICAVKEPATVAESLQRHSQTHTYCTKCTNTHLARAPHNKRAKEPEMQQHCCKTNQLPWLQQHLVLNQTIGALNSKCQCVCQSSCQQSDLTVCTDAENTNQSAQLPKERTLDEHESNSSSNTHARKAHTHLNCYPALKPQSYFEELLLRDKKTKSCISSCYDSCKKSHKPRAPVKVDINVRLVPKSSSSKKEETHKIKEIVEVHKVEANKAEELREKAEKTVLLEDLEELEEQESKTQF